MNISITHVFLSSNFAIGHTMLQLQMKFKAIYKGILLIYFMFHTNTMFIKKLS